MPIWKVELIEEAHADFKNLDGNVKKQVLKQLLKLVKRDRALLFCHPQVFCRGNRSQA